jgi:hypothetical protein
MMASREWFRTKAQLVQAGAQQGAQLHDPTQPLLDRRCRYHRLGQLALTPVAQAAGSIRIAFGDIATVETLNFLIAVETLNLRGDGTEIG